MPFVTQVSDLDIQLGRHADVNEGKSLLIQIANPEQGFPSPKKTFNQIVQFQFYDVQYETGDTTQEIWNKRISDDQARQIANFLIEAHANNTNVFVQCCTGTSRSSAIVEVAKNLGFRVINKGGRVNLYVSRTVGEAAGLCWFL